MAEGNFFRRMFDALLAEGALQLAAYAAPPVLTAAVAYLGISENLPWAYVLTATVVVFAAAATGLLRFSEWRQRISARNKVTLEWVNFSYDGDKGDLGHLQNLKAVQFLISLKNDAVFRMLSNDWTSRLRTKFPATDFSEIRRLNYRQIQVAGFEMARLILEG